MYFKGNTPPPIILCNLIVEVDLNLTTHGAIPLFLFPDLLHSQYRGDIKEEVLQVSKTHSAPVRNRGLEKPLSLLQLFRLLRGEFYLAAQEPPALNLI